MPFNVILGLNWGCIHCLRVFENLIAAVQGTAGTGEVWKKGNKLHETNLRLIWRDAYRAQELSGLWLHFFKPSHKSQTVPTPRANIFKLFFAPYKKQCLLLQHVLLFVS